MSEGIAGMGYRAPSYQPAADQVWFPVLYGHVPGYQLEYIYRPRTISENPSRLEPEHMRHLTNLIKFLEAASGADVAISLGNLSSSDTRHRAGHGGLAMICSLRVSGASDQAGRQRPVLVQCALTVDQPITAAGLAQVARDFVERVLRQGPAWYIRYCDEPPGQVEPIERYLEAFGPLPPLPGQEWPGPWRRADKAGPRRLYITCASLQVTAELIACAARVAAILYHSDLRWTSVTTGYEAQRDEKAELGVRLVLQERRGGPGNEDERTVSMEEVLAMEEVHLAALLGLLPPQGAAVPAVHAPDAGPAGRGEAAAPGMEGRPTALLPAVEEGGAEANPPGQAISEQTTEPPAPPMGEEQATTMAPPPVAEQATTVAPPFVAEQATTVAPPPVAEQVTTVAPPVVEEVTTISVKEMEPTEIKSAESFRFDPDQTRTLDPLRLQRSTVRELPTMAHISLPQGRGAEQGAEEDKRSAGTWLGVGVAALILLLAGSGGAYYVIEQRNIEQKRRDALVQVERERAAAQAVRDFERRTAADLAAARAEKERARAQAELAAARAEKERARAWAEQQKKDRAAQERAERMEQARAAREKAEKAAREKAEKAAREKAEAEREWRELEQRLDEHRRRGVNDHAEVKRIQQAAVDELHSVRGMKSEQFYKDADVAYKALAKIFADAPPTPPQTYKTLSELRGVEAAMRAWAAGIHALIEKAQKKHDVVIANVKRLKEAARQRKKGEPQPEKKGPKP